MIGTPSPKDVPRDQLAAWYWGRIQHEVELHERHGYGPVDEGCLVVQDLIVGAIEAGVIGHCIPVAGFSEPQPLHSLVAPYRTRPGGLAEQQEAARRAALDRPVPRRFRSVDPA